jgi:hypothetical protein
MARAMLSTAPDGGTSSSKRGAPRSYGRGIADDPPPMQLAVRHIGPSRAPRLLDALGDDWREVLDHAPTRVFGALRGVGPAQADAAASSWIEISGHASTPKPAARG